MTNFSFGEGGRGRKLPETLSEEEVLKLAAAVRKKRHKLAILLGFYACLRVSEVVKLLPENVDKGQRLLRVKEGKGGKDRNVPLAPQLVRVVGELPVKCGVRALEMVVKNYGRKVLGRDVHFHTLRHSGATFYLKKGLNIREVQQLLGHASLQTTQIYTHVSPDEMIKKIWGET